MKLVRRHLSYANVAATLALVFAMSGGALAATHYLVNSTKQINPTVLKALKGNNGTNGANGAHGTPGPAGPQGAQGTPGPAGPAGDTGPEGQSGQSKQGPPGQEGKEGPQGKEGKEGKEGGSGVSVWTAITSHNKLTRVSGFQELGVRTENAGATARLRGVLEVTSTVEAGETLFTIPAGFLPKEKLNLEFGAGVSSASGANHPGSLVISGTTGNVTDPETPVPPGNYYLFDGITWNLN